MHEASPGELVDLTIERILPGGFGLAHAGERTVMVALAAPGDRLRVHIDRVRGNVYFASIEAILEAAPSRIEPPCPYFGRCGGCDFQHLSYESQLAAKVEIINDCLRRIGHIKNPPEVSITPAPEAWHYRSRAQWQHDPVRRRLGYFERASHRVCDVVECAVLVRELQETLQALREQMRERALPDGARDFRAVAGEQGVSLAPSPEGETAPDVSILVGEGHYGLNAETFFQTNVMLLPKLIAAALRSAGGSTAVDLYCGVGLFTLPLARQFAHVVGVEADSTAARYGRANLAAGARTNAGIVDVDVNDWLERDAGAWVAKHSDSGALDYLLLDPPRAGAERRTVNGILALRPRRICYVACDPATLARDLGKLISGDYALKSLAAFDMFPQTHHVEIVVHLGRLT